MIFLKRVQIFSLGFLLKIIIYLSTLIFGIQYFQTISEKSKVTKDVEYPEDRSRTVQKLIDIYDTKRPGYNVEKPAELADSWMTDTVIHPDYVPELGSVLEWMATVRITEAFSGIDDNGVGTETQGSGSKLQFVLEGGHKCLFKLKNFEINDTTALKHKDRHNSEIAAYHFQRLLGFNRAPVVVGRKVDIKKEIVPAASQQLRDSLIYKENGDVCIGLGMKGAENLQEYCGQDGKLEGAMVFWLPRLYTDESLPFIAKRGRRMKNMTQAMANGFRLIDQPFAKNQRMYFQFIEMLFFDYLTQNTDHKYMYFKTAPTGGSLILIDNGKAFRTTATVLGELLELAFEHCKVREEFYLRLRELQGGVLTQTLRHILSRDPLAPVLWEPHYVALENRINDIVVRIEMCIEQHSESYVLVKEKDICDTS